LETSPKGGDFNMGRYFAVFYAAFAPTLQCAPSESTIPTDEDSPLLQCHEMLPDLKCHIHDCPAKINRRSISPLNTA